MASSLGALALILTSAGCLAAPAASLPPSQTLQPSAADSKPPPMDAEATPPGLEVLGSFTPPARACAGPADWLGVPNLVRRLGDAWHEEDDTARRAILDEVWGEEGVYQDPDGDRVVGRDALTEVMGFGVAPSRYIELRGWDAGDLHHDYVRLAWRHCCPSGLPLLEGTDIATIDPNGRIARIVSFWSQVIAAPADDACEMPADSQVPEAPPSVAATDVDVCKSPEIDWSGFPPTAQMYGRAWNERDPAGRLTLLEAIWAEDAWYLDMSFDDPVIGQESMSEHIGEVLDGWQGAYFEPLPMSEGDHHHANMRMPWRFCDTDGTVVSVGEETVELDAAGLILRDVGFFRPQ